MAVYYEGKGGWQSTMKGEVGGSTGQYTMNGRGRWQSTMKGEVGDSIL